VTHVAHIPLADPLPTAHYSLFTIHSNDSNAVPLRSNSHKRKIYTSKRSNCGTCPRSVVSNQMSGPKAPNQLFADRSSLIARVCARKAPRV